jgi:hypothetical protein
MIFFNFGHLGILLWIFMSIASAIIFPFKIIEADENVRIKKSLRVLPVNNWYIFYSKYLLSNLLVQTYTAVSSIFFFIWTDMIQFLDFKLILTFYLFLIVLTSCVFVIRINFTEIQSAIIFIFLISVIIIFCFATNLFELDNIKDLFIFLKFAKKLKLGIYIFPLFLTSINLLGFKFYKEIMSYRRLQ